MKDIIFAASESFTLIGRPTKKQVVGWNKFCKDLYSKTRHNYLRWPEAGRIRTGELFHIMKESRAKFEKALK